MTVALGADAFVPRINRLLDSRPVAWAQLVTGVALFLLTMGFSFTGYLLPWTQLSYWATVIATEAPGAMPLMGPLTKSLMLGGPDISQVTLSRFFTLHVMVLPFAAFSLLVAHFLQIRRQGISGPM